MIRCVLLVLFIATSAQALTTKCCCTTTTLTTTTTTLTTTTTSTTTSSTTTSSTTTTTVTTTTTLTTSTTTTTTATTTTTVTTSTTTTTTSSSTTTTTLAGPVFTLLDSGSIPFSTSDHATTATVTPANNSLLVLVVFNNRAASSGDAILSVSTTTGETFVCDAGATLPKSGDNFRVSMCRAQVASPTSGTVTVTFALTQTQIQYHLIQVTGVNTGGTNGSAAFLQPASNQAGSGTGTLVVTLSAFANVANIGLGAFGVQGDAVTTAGSGCTTISTVAPGFARSVVEYCAQNDVTVDASWSDNTQNKVGVAAEIAVP